jgi:phage/plasmid primase-like uncharacterized protein
MAVGMNSAPEQFRDAIRAAGLVPPDVIEADGKLRRFSSNGKRDDAGWYVLHGDGIPAGAFGDWRTGIEQTWRGDIGRKLTFAEAQELQRRKKAAQREREAEEAKCHQEARDRARAIWKTAPIATDHPYLSRKGVKAFGLRISDGRLLVPMIDTSGELRSLQFIDADGEKRYLAGGAKQACYHAIGKPNGALCIAEGYATAASVHQATGHAVAVAFDAGNIEPVARALRAKYLDLQIIVCADDDSGTPGNPGRTKATTAALAVGGLVAVPDFGADRPVGATDFNDAMQHCGSDAVRQAITRARAPEVSEVQAALASATTGVNGDGKGAAGHDTKLSRAERLVRLALDLFEIARSELDEPFALKKDGPQIALMFRGSRDALRSTLAREFRRRTGTTPNASALSDALTALQGEALEAEPRPVHLRVAGHGAEIVLDLGRQDGQVVLIRAGAWELLRRSPVIFRRTALTGELPIPERGGSIAMLRSLLNVTDETWPLVLGWLVAAFLPDIPHPVLMLGGEQGSGKTTAGKVLVRLVDPSPAPVRSQPSDPEGWAMAAAGSWVIAVDNVSAISAWWSDCLCKAVTGDGLIRRKLYTDSELAVLAFRRVVALTSIDAGALRGDLGDRILLADLEPIAKSKRRSEAELEQAYQHDRAQIFGALLDLVATVLAKLPNVRLTALPRMADFARVLAAVDAVHGTEALKRYFSQRGRVAEEVLDADPVAGAIRALAARGNWTGTQGDLLERITPSGGIRTSEWPKSARGLTARLRRLTPALRQVGVDILIPDARSSRGRIIEIRQAEQEEEQPEEQPSQSSQQTVPEGIRRDDRGEGSDDQHGLVTVVSSPLQREGDGCDDSDGECPTLSDVEVF